MSNKIVYDGFEFTDNQILSGSLSLQNSMIAESLSGDTLTFTITVPAREGLRDSLLRKLFDSSHNRLYAKNQYGDLSSYTYGDTVSYYHDNSLVGKFYVTEVVRVAPLNFMFNCVSAIGLLIHKIHNGGVYGEGQIVYATDLIEEILGDAEVEIDSAFDTALIQGWLPRRSARDNLKEVLFGLGASVLKDSSGNLVIKYNEPETAVQINASKIYMSHTETHPSHATLVTLIEHGYYKSQNVIDEELFNNLNTIEAAVNYTLVFSKPYHSLRAYDGNGTDITSQFVVESGDNYAIIGTTTVNQARLVGKAYVHTQKKLQKRIVNNPLVENEVQVTNATLISALNSANCLERLAAYYGEANEVDMSFVNEGEKTGNMIQFPNVYDYSQSQLGYIKSQNITMSGILKSQSKVATNWQPNHLGNTYNRYIIIDKEELGGLTGNWTVPSSLNGKEAYIVMFSGADGGQGGTSGENGVGGNAIASNDVYIAQIATGVIFRVDLRGPAGTGGQGGQGGTGGHGAKRYGSVKLNMVTGATYSVSLGEGGNGGTVGTLGGEGGQTTFGSYTSDQQDLDGVYVNIVDRAIYCGTGSNGIAGANGGNGGASSQVTCDTTHQISSEVFYESGTNGGAVTVGDVTYSGGNGSAGNNNTADYYRTIGEASTLWWGHHAVGGGGGGGACATGNGTNGGNADTSVRWHSHNTQAIVDGSKKGGAGGNGASPLARPQASTLGKGGDGGHGGGGGGGAGASDVMNNNNNFDPPKVLPNGGAGGTGGTGGKGSDGFCIIYYQE